MGYLMFLAAIVLFFLLLITRTYLQSRREEKEYGDRILYHFGEQPPDCLLYTSDAADEL